MLKTAFLFLAFSFLWSEEDLYGLLKDNVWKSDKDATVTWIEQHNSKLGQNERLLHLFGKSTFQFSDGKVTMTSGEEGAKAITEDGVFIKQIGDSLVFQCRDPFTGKDVPRVVEFNKDRNGYSLFVRLHISGIDVEFREFFRRITTTPASKR
jgi:hypothetical protein